MHTYYLLVTEVDHRHSEHERRVKAVANDRLTADLNVSRLQSWREKLAHVRLAPLARRSKLEAPATRLSLGANCAGS